MMTGSKSSSAEVNAQGSIETVLSRSRTYSNSGCYSNALEMLREGLNGQTDGMRVRTIHTEMIRVHLIQGDHRSITELNIAPTDNPNSCSDLLRLYSETNCLWTDMDLTRPLEVAAVFYEKYLPSLNASEGDEFVARIILHCLVIRDWILLYGEGLAQPKYQLDQQTLKILMTKLIEHGLYLEVLDAFEFLVDEAGESLREVSSYLGSLPFPIGCLYQLCVVRVRCREGKYEEASVALQALEQPLDARKKRATARRWNFLGSKSGREKQSMQQSGPVHDSASLTLQRDALQQRFFVQSDAAARVQELIRIAKDLLQGADFLSAFRTLEGAAELLNAVQNVKKAFDLGKEVHEALLTLCSRNDDRLSKILIEFRFCDFLNSSAGSLALSRKYRGELLDLAAGIKLPYLQRYHRRQWEEYFMLHQREPAIYHAEQYLAYCRQFRCGEEQSLAENLRLESTFLPFRTSEEARSEFLYDLKDCLEREIIKDGEQHWYRAMIEKQLLLVNVLWEVNHLEGEEIEEAAAAALPVLDEATRLISQLPNSDDTAALKCHLSFVYASAAYRTDSEMFKNYTQVATAPVSGAGGELQLRFDKANPGRLLQQLIAAIKSDDIGLFIQAYPKLCELLEDTPSKLDSVRQAAALSAKGVLYYFLAQIKNDSGRQFWATVGLESCRDIQHEALSSLTQAFQLKTRISEEAKDVGQVHDKIAQWNMLQAYLSSGLDQQQHHEMCLEMCMDMQDSFGTWKWMQMGKARAFTNMLKESGLVAATQTSQLIAQDNPVLEDLRFIQSASAYPLVFVDWIVYGFGENRLLSSISQIVGDECRMTQIEVDADVEQLRQAATRINEARMDSADYERYLRPFSSLIQPLLTACSPQDILVLSPVSPFQNIPLHAVPVGTSTLIERNPVIYVPSHIALLGCVQRLSAPHPGVDAPQEWHAVVTAAYDDDQTDDAKKNEERKEVYELNANLASDLGAVRLVGSDLTLESVTIKSRAAAVLHFHGHGIRDAEDPTKQCLALGRAMQTLKMSDIVSLNLKATHVTLIACSSAAQDFSVFGDEPLGLLSAFLLGGAASVVGALWPIQSRTGRVFTETYYDYFLRHVDRGELGPIVNIARCLQHSILELMNRPETATPYHWAPFVCYGAWFCQRKPGSW